MADRDTDALRSELLRVSLDMSKGLGAFQVMLAQRDAKIAVLEERVAAMRQTFDDSRRSQDTASHDLARVREQIAVEEAKRRGAGEAGEKWIRYAVAFAKVAAVSAGPVSLLWQALK